MIISASRRTDIPAFYTKWFINRVRAGYCTVPNPFNKKQIFRVSLKPDDVDVVVFWTRNPRPLMPYLDELDSLGLRYYFQYTIMNNPREIDTKSPSLATSIKTFKQLSDTVSPDRVIWRYDPIVLSPLTGINFHLKTYEHIAQTLQQYTKRSVISVVDFYSKAKSRFSKLSKNGLQIVEYTGQPNTKFDEFIVGISQIARNNGLEIVSCAEEIDLSPYNIPAGKCIDDSLIERVFNIPISHKKDVNQRKVCGCVTSKDIGMYDSCLFGCQYCYATSSFEKAKVNYKEHDPNSPSIVGWYEVENTKSNEPLQPSLFD